ncbi:MAG: hypothetical protein MZV70_40075 [Desulfobacterales bacterium]|nr:hypothetical protein [Desulfobacterales bacterium]
MREISVFLCGAVVMVIELTGSRVLAPYLRDLAGGLDEPDRHHPRLAEPGVLVGRPPGGPAGPRRGCSGGSSCWPLWRPPPSPLTKAFVLGFLQSQGAGLHAAAVWATLLLFAPPAVLLGMVAPFAVRLKLSDTQTSGRTAGNLYAISTIGSIVGTFRGRLRAHRLAGQHEHSSAHGRGAGAGLPAGGAQRRPPQGCGLRPVPGRTSCDGRLRCPAGSRGLRGQGHGLQPGDRLQGCRR